jgi:hypothetical protein
MYYTLLRLYSQGKITDVSLKNAVALGWISEVEKQSIVGGNANA